MFFMTLFFIALFVVFIRALIGASGRPTPAPAPASDSRFMKPVEFDPAKAERATSAGAVIAVTFALLAIMAILSPLLVG